jgi:site-specific DNA-cytosine methylase
MGLRILDLFSGIGGFSYALHPIAKTVAYCEIAPEARAVLKQNMKRNLLQKAPIYDDVCDIGKSVDIRHLKPNMITAGFPCTDISSANPAGQGLKGEHSGLFKQIVRIIDAYLDIHTVLLENSPRIKGKGLSYVCQVMRKRGFQVRYTFMEVINVGGYHRRKRWYCLCVKPQSSDLPAIPSKLLTNSAWLHPYDKHVITHFRDRVERDRLRSQCALLGNAIVPFCLRYAWNCLITQTSEYAFHPPLKQTALQRLEFKDGTHTVAKDFWATPTHSVWHNYSSITDRGIKVLSNQTFYFTKSHLLHKGKSNSYTKFTASPAFVEYLMGYPDGWTKLL